VTHLNTNEAAFETVIKSHLLANGYARIADKVYRRLNGSQGRTVI